MTHQQLQTHIETAFNNAENGISKITKDIINMEGMTGIKTRHFYNNLLNYYICLQPHPMYYNK